MSDIFKRPRLSIGYVAAAVAVIGVVAVVALKWTGDKVHVPTPETQQFYEKGLVALREGTSFKASKLLERAVGADSQFALAHARLAEAYSELDASDRAKITY